MATQNSGNFTTATAGYVLVANGVDVAPSFQPVHVTGYYSMTPYIVGTDANAQYSTIASAIAASAGSGQILIKPGTYVENLTIPTGTKLVGLQGNTEFGYAVNIQGHHTITGTVEFNNISFDSSASGSNTTFSGAADVGLNNCTIQPSGKGIFDGVDGRVQVMMKGCKFFNTLLAPVTGTGQVNAFFIYDSYHVSDASDLVTFAAIPSGTSELTLELYNFFSDATVLLSDSGNFCTNLTVNAFGSQFPMGVTVSSSCPIVITAYGSNSPSVNVVGGTTASQLIFSNGSFPVSSLSSFGGTAIFSNSNDIPTGGGVVASTNNLEKYYFDTGSPPKPFKGSEKVSSQGCLQTTGNTATTIVAIALAEVESITVQGTIIGASADHTDATGGYYLISARRQSGGNITIVGSATNTVNATSTGTFAISVDVGTQSVLLKVTGLAATTYNWNAHYSYEKILSQA